MVLRMLMRAVAPIVTGHLYPAAMPYTVESAIVQQNFCCYQVILLASWDRQRRLRAEAKGVAHLPTHPPDHVNQD